MPNALKIFVSVSFMIMNTMPHGVYAQGYEKNCDYITHEKNIVLPPVIINEPSGKFEDALIRDADTTLVLMLI